MGFWDFIAPDYEGFKEALVGLVPDQVQLGSVSLTREQLVDLAWANPASGAGLAGRLFYQGGAVQGTTQAQAASLAQAQLDNLVRGGAYPVGANGIGMDLTLGVGMAPIVVPNCYAGTVKARFGGQPVLNTFHFTAGSAGQEQPICTALQGAWKVATGPLTRFGSAYVLEEFEVIDLSTATGGIWVIADTTAGARASTSVAGRQTSALITYNGQTRSRSSRGRTYLGPLYEDDIAANGASLETTSVTAVGNAMTAFRNYMSSLSFPMVVLSRKLLTAYPITLQRVEPIIATQRRRLR